MLDEKTIEKYYRGESRTELERLQNFIKTHEVKQIIFQGKSIRYYACGLGEKTILTFSGGYSGLETVYDSILGFESTYRMVVVDISEFCNLDDFSTAVNQILDREGVERVFVMGQSASGVFAQAYTKRNLHRIDALILTNTFAPSPKKNRRWGFILLRIIPIFLLRAVFNKKLRGWTGPEDKLSPDTRERIQFKAAFLRHMIDAHFTKRTIMNLVRMIFEFNEKDAHPESELSDWNGRVLIITSPDDVCHKDIEILIKQYPNAKLFEFEEGHKHLAPIVHRDRFLETIKAFFDRTPPSKDSRPNPRITQ